MRALLRRFATDQGGSLTVESVLALPFLFWAYVGCFVFFDAFHARSVTLKGAYTIGDTLSRETGEVTPAYMDSLYALQGFLVGGAPHRLRVTVIHLADPGSDALGDETYDVRWSRVRGGGQELTDDTIAALGPRIPQMAKAAVAVMVETSIDYMPIRNWPLDPMTYDDFVVTRLRFAPQLCWNDLNNGDATTRVC